MQRLFINLLVYTSLAAFLSGCHNINRHHSPVHDHGYRHGPPPHAPAHGYRHKHQDHDLVYDSRLGVYIVVGLPDYYYHDGHYYRHHKNRWFISDGIERGWVAHDERKLPRHLARHYDPVNKAARQKGRYNASKGKHGNRRGNPHQQYDKD